VRKQVKVRLDDCSGGDDDDEAAAIVDAGDHGIQPFAPVGLEEVEQSGFDEKEAETPVDSRAAVPAGNGIHRTEMEVQRMKHSIPPGVVAETSQHIRVDDILATLDAGGSTADTAKSDQNDLQLQ
jgi:hypothetical protein